MEIVRKHERLFDIEINRKTLRTPFFFPAISSMKTNLEIDEYLRLVQKIEYPGVLVSAYDIHQEMQRRQQKLIDFIRRLTEGGTITFLDSGNYEAYWYRDEKWTFENLEAILSRVDVDLCFSFDVFWNSKNTLDQHFRETITSIARTAGAQRSGTTVPILHADSETLPRVARDVVEGINPEIVGIPDRELGDEILQRAVTIRKIRNELDRTGRQIPLHILGTGDPISLLIYTLAGADIFDALEWCTTTVDHNTAHLHHFTHRGLLGCRCTACKMKRMTYHVQTIAHNLIFYRGFTEKIRSHIVDDEIDQVLLAYLPLENLERVKRAVGLG